MTSYDAVVVGSGPNGLAAAITIAREGFKVLVLEAKDTVGGGCRTGELTLPGFTHDICSAIHPLAVTSPFFQTLPLNDFGLEWVYPSASLAHPLDDGPPVIAEYCVDDPLKGVDATAATLGPDGAAYRGLFAPLVEKWSRLADDLLGPLPFPPKNLFLMTRFGLGALWPARMLAQTLFKGQRARAIFAGMAGHSMLRMEHLISAAYGLVLTSSAHAVGWPFAKGGSQKIVEALTAHLRSLGGEIETGHEVKSLSELPPARAVLCDVTPRQLIQIAGDRLPNGYRRQLENYRYGPGVCKVDFALSGPIPWKSAECARAATVHLGGTFDEIATGESAVWRGEHPERPYVLLAQHTLFDDTRAPQGQHTAWAYCHVPNGSTRDTSPQIEAQIERFAPGFRDLVLAKSVRTATEMERYNPNYIGGDINGGAQDIRQLYTRPAVHFPHYGTPVKGLYICSSSTPPGGGVHGMCGYFAALTALADMHRA
ncbi:MAG: phytoene desaturase family protein [Anaerolineales bacterium]